jgi:hypothetical protein
LVELSMPMNKPKPSAQKPGKPAENKGGKK